jgi:pimeloyl-ACP methyl ester carboxylesterase
MMLTHGIYGSGSNWRSIARKVVERRPTWGFALFDLRQHGKSEPGTPPHTLDACAGDVLALADELAAAGSRVAAVGGHSFGGKVVLAVRAARPAWLDQTWVLDSTPRARPDTWDRPGNSVRAVWDSMAALPARWQRRDDFIAALEVRGHAKSLAQWVAMNLVADGGELVRRLDLDAVKEMMLDYHQRDLWSAVEDPSLPGDVQVVIGGKSDTLSADDRARLAAEPPENRVHSHVIDHADHWVHADAPDAVVELIARHLPGST